MLPLKAIRNGIRSVAAVKSVGAKIALYQLPERITWFTLLSEGVRLLQLSFILRLVTHRVEDGADGICIAGLQPVVGPEMCKQPVVAPQVLVEAACHQPFRCEVSRRRLKVQRTGLRDSQPTGGISESVTTGRVRAIRT